MPTISAIGAAPRAPSDATEASVNRCAEITIPCARDLRYSGTRAVVVVEAQPSDIVTETITMIILAIVASLGVIAVLCWLLFTLAVFALPFFAAVGSLSALLLRP